MYPYFVFKCSWKIHLYVCKVQLHEAILSANLTCQFYATAKTTGLPRVGKAQCAVTVGQVNPLRAHCGLSMVADTRCVSDLHSINETFSPKGFFLYFKQLFRDMAFFYASVIFPVIMDDSEILNFSPAVRMSLFLYMAPIHR